MTPRYVKQKIELKGMRARQDKRSKPDAETSHAPTTQDNSGTFQAVMPLFKAREELSH
jgi:hypothetical protein